MRNVIIQCLLCASVTFGIWIAVFSIYLRYNHVKKQAKIQEKGNPFIWSLGEKLQSKPNSMHILRAYNVRVERQSEDEPAEPKLLLRLGENFNYSIPELRHGYSTYGFNPIISKNLGHYRNVPDTRNVMCRKKTYPAKLPTASIIICFHNEEFSALFRTLSSIMTLTSQYILEEIILVDDMSDFDDLKEKLDYHLEIFRGKIKLIRNKKREGLIRARMTGASHASGDVLVFLDSHCEVNKVWLEPLLNAIAKDPKMVVCPLIDVIDYLSLEYQPSPIVRGAFNWHLEFKWDHVFSYEIEGPEGPTTPIRSPAMPGGIFAISRHYFNEIGQYDKGMNLWGGENLELSLRIWMCGGQLYVIPCSRVGHINRQHMTNHSEVIKAMEYNNLRLVHTWLDEYKVKDTSLVWEDESEQRGTSSEEAFYCLPDTKFCAFPYIRVQVVLVVKNPPANAGRHKRHGFHPWVGRSPGEGHGYPLQYSCLENPKDRGAWGVTVHRIAKRQTGLKPLSTHVPFQFVTHSFSDPIRD